MTLPFYNWSRTAASNATADATVNWAEGQSPSSVNDSARAMMASTAAYRDDVAGAIATGGTSTAYTVTSYQIFDTLAHLNGQLIAFTPHATNGATVTLNVDGLGAKPLRSSPSVELPAGVIVQGTPYAALYNSSDGAFYLHGFFTNPYSIPIGASVDFWGGSAPNSSFVLAYGQGVSRATYSVLFGIIGTSYGTGDGSTTFNVPDLRGRYIAGADNMGGSAASRLTSTYLGAAATIGNTGGSQSHTLTLGELPTGITSTGSNTAIAPNSQNFVTASGTETINFQGGSTNRNIPISSSLAANASGALISDTVTSSNTSGSAHSIVPPTIIGNKLIRII